jgi:hypothetical protein
MRLALTANSSSPARDGFRLVVICDNHSGPAARSARAIYDRAGQTNVASSLTRRRRPVAEHSALADPAQSDGRAARLTPRSAIRRDRDAGAGPTVRPASAGSARSARSPYRANGSAGKMGS